MSLLLIYLSILVCFIDLSKSDTWGYSENGLDWAGLCRTGKRQSPINILTDEVRACKITNPEVSLTFRNTNANIAWSIEAQTYVETFEEFKEGYAFLRAPDLNGIVQSYTLLNVHFHAYGEHQVDNVNSKLEMHMVFKADNPITDDNYAVVGARFELAKNDVQRRDPGVSIIDLINPSNDDKVLDFNFHKYFDGVLNKPGQRFYHYKGSLTNPPCVEVVNWYLMERVFYMKEEDFKHFYDTFYSKEFSKEKGNFRFPQPLNGRNPCFVKIPDSNLVNTFLSSKIVNYGIFLISIVFSFSFF